MVTVDELEGWLQEVCTNLRHVLRHERRDSAARLTEQAKAYIVGYMEPNYFSYVFKKQYGISPSKYRAEMSVKEKNED